MKGAAGHLQEGAATLHRAGVIVTRGRAKTGAVLPGVEEDEEDNKIVLIKSSMYRQQLAKLSLPVQLFFTPYFKIIN
jgi:hypothetical protein